MVTWMSIPQSETTMCQFSVPEKFNTKFLVVVYKYFPVIETWTGAPQGTEYAYANLGA